MPQSLADLSPAGLRRAAALKEKIQSLQRELERLLGGRAEPVAATGRPRKKRKMSAEGKARIAEAQRRRWAKVRRESGK
jgi:hypothetical protein